MVSGGPGRIRLGGAGHPRRRVRACSGVRFLRHGRERRPPGRHRCAKRRERRVPRSRPDDAERRGPYREANHPLNSGSFPAARLRRAVPGPTGRTAQRSAFPCLRVTLHGGVEPRGEPPPNTRNEPDAIPPAPMTPTTTASPPDVRGAPPSPGCSGYRRPPGSCALRPGSAGRGTRHPELPASTEDGVGLPGGEHLPALHDLAEWKALELLYEEMDVVRHHTPLSKLVALPVKADERFTDQSGDLGAP